MIWALQRARLEIKEPDENYKTNYIHNRSESGFPKHLKKPQISIHKQHVYHHTRPIRHDMVNNNNKDLLIST